jgi:hypothetical protein
VGRGTWVAYQESEFPRSLCFLSWFEAFRRSEEQGKTPRSVKMLGWTILFALISLSGMVVTLAGHSASLCLKTASVIFATLFFLILLTRALRGRAR